MFFVVSRSFSIYVFFSYHTDFFLKMATMLIIIGKLNICAQSCAEIHQNARSRAQFRFYKKLAGRAFSSLVFHRVLWEPFRKYELLRLKGVIMVRVHSQDFGDAAAEAVGATRREKSLKYTASGRSSRLRGCPSSCAKVPPDARQANTNPSVMSLNCV